MNVQAQNAFLKTLEEPPPRTLLLLLTSHPERLLATTRSRVIEIGLMPPAGTRIFTEHENKLLIVLGKHAAKSSGTLSGALALKMEFEEILEELREDLKKKHEDEFERETEHYGKTTDGSWLKQREDQVEAAIEADYIQQRSALMDLLLSWFGDVARQQAGVENLDLPKHQSLTATLATNWEPADVAKRVRILRQLESHLHTNVNESLALEVCFIQAFGS
jgi:DNA polymerase-3 subunit delta'